MGMDVKANAQAEVAAATELMELGPIGKHVEPVPLSVLNLFLLPKWKMEGTLDPKRRSQVDPLLPEDQASELVYVREYTAETQFNTSLCSFSWLGHLAGSSDNNHWMGGNFDLDKVYWDSDLGNGVTDLVELEDAGFEDLSGTK